MLRILAPISAAALCVVGCNHDNVRGEQQQERAELRQEHASEQHEVNQEQAELTQDQHQERAELNQEHAEERSEFRQDSREDLVEGSNELGSTTDRDDLSQEVRDLNALVSQACVGVAESERATCPLSSERVEAVSNISDGVRIKLTPVAGTKDVLEHRIACYRARAEIRHSMERISSKHQTGNLALNECLLDQPGVEMALKDTDGRVELELTADSTTRVRDLRSQARGLSQTGAKVGATNQAGNGNGVATR